MKTKALAELLEEKDMWELATALRGPDSGDMLLKTVTTAVIRGFLVTRPELIAESLGRRYYNSYEVCTPEVAMRSWEDTKRPDCPIVYSGIREYHFLAHVRKAFNVLALEFPEAAKYKNWLVEQKIISQDA